MNLVDYRNAFFMAIGIHILLVVMLFTESSSQRPVLVNEKQNTPGVEQPLANSAPQQELVKAVSVDNKEVMQTVERIKKEREQQRQAELNRQQELNRQLQNAKQQRIKEQQQLAKLKEEANKIAIARKKQAEEEKKHLLELANQKAAEAKKIEELKKEKERLAQEHELEAKKLAKLNKKAEQRAQKEKLLAEQDQALKEKKLAEQAAAESKKQAEADAAQKALNAQRQAKISGEVNKYKALIISAIGRNWILPENANAALSSKFRIRLAPDGMVLEVTLINSSGDPLLDRSAQTAIYKASPLPVPKDTETFNLFRTISLTVRPEQVRG